MIPKKGANIACAACKHQRRKCYDCPLAQYFPPHYTQQFQNVHRLYGVSSVMKILNSLDGSLWPAVMETIQFEADARANDPVNGCAGIIRELEAQVEASRKELEILNQQLLYCKQKDSQYQNMLASTSATPLPPLSGHQYHPPDLVDLTNETDNIEEMKRSAYSHPFKEYEGMKNFNQTMQVVIGRNEAKESSAESAVRGTPALDHASNTKLKNVAEPFGLSNTMLEKGKKCVDNY